MIGDIIEIERAKHSIGDVRIATTIDADVLRQARKATGHSSTGTTPTLMTESLDAVRKMLVALRRRGRST